MALTEQGIQAVRRQNNLLYENMNDYYNIARRAIEDLQSNPEFRKYLDDTERGKALMQSLQNILQTAEALHKKSAEFSKVSIESFINKQMRLNAER